ncbi:MAG TPA: ribosome biogenesis factor YjgA [Usitatibacter sp.]|nr:ribosome biogenesis factor YjgA [Usitatibacter sp.]
MKLGKLAAYARREEMQAEEDDFISKTRRKRQMTELQKLGAALVELSPEQLARIDMPEALREAVLDCKRFNKHEAIRRQMQYIGRIMRDIDAGPIAEQLAAFQAPSRRQTALFHVAEKWRDDLLADPAAIVRFEREFPHADAHRVRVLIEAARSEREAKRAPKHFRELFHAVSAVVQEHARGS